jgi:uncharacterized lipoprotein NlpE involved in copper resistance
MIAAVCTWTALRVNNNTQEVYELPEDMIVDPAHNSENSLDWAGTYQGTTPAANGTGIKVRITLDYDNNYEIVSQHLGKADSAILKAAGKFAWSDDGSDITFDSNSRGMPQRYKVGENVLFQLDMDGNIIEGEHAQMYELHKIIE